VNHVIQLSVPIAAESGLVSDVTGILGDAGVNIRGFSFSDKADRGTLRLVVDDTERAAALLWDAGYAVKEGPVVCIDLPDQAGGLAGVLKTVDDAGVDIDYVYSLFPTYVVLNVSDVERAVALLTDRPVRLVTAEEVAGL
jgi:hypothetical protein